MSSIYEEKSIEHRTNAFIQEALAEKAESEGRLGDAWRRRLEAKSQTSYANSYEEAERKRKENKKEGGGQADMFPGERSYD